jgi:hypothetical protein
VLCLRVCRSLLSYLAVLLLIFAVNANISPLIWNLLAAGSGSGLRWELEGVARGWETEGGWIESSNIPTIRSI